MEVLKRTTTDDGPGVIRCYQGGFFKVLISPEQTGGEMALVDMSLPKGVDPPMHVHSREDETFYILEGAITFLVGETEIKAKAGDAVFAPRQVPHRFVIESESVRFLTVITPGRFLEYFFEFSFPSVEEAKVTAPLGPPPAEVIQRMTASLTGKYGVLFI